MKSKVVLLFIVCALAGTVLAACQTEEGPVMDDPKDLRLEEVVDFYYTYNCVGYNAKYQRYRFYIEDGKYMFFYETRGTEDDYGWNTEDDIITSGTVELTAEDWTTFLGFLENGSVREPEESLEDGDAGPWMFIYYPGEGDPVRMEYLFATPGDRTAFEEYCAALAQTD